MKHFTLISIIRWAARITGTLMVIFVLIFAVGNFIEGLDKPKPDYNTYTIVIFIIWGTGLAGLILALWKEGLGGIISLLCFIVFNILTAVNTTPGSSYTYVLLLFMIPSILYLVYWLLEKNSSRKILINK